MSDCPECNGTGIVLSVDSEPCPAGEQTGKILDCVCSCCNGSGTLLVEVKVLCWGCDGRGAIGPHIYGQGSGI